MTHQFVRGHIKLFRYRNQQISIWDLLPKNNLVDNLGTQKQYLRQISLTHVKIHKAKLDAVTQFLRKDFFHLSLRRRLPSPQGM